MSSITTINLPMYTFVTSLVNPQELRIKIMPKGLNKTYQTILHHDSSSSQLFNSFERFSDFIQHIKLPEHSSFNFESQQMVIHGSGTVGKNRKYFEIHRLKLEQVEEYNLQHVIQECLKISDLTTKQLRHFILCIATELSKIGQQNRESKQKMKNHTEQTLSEFVIEQNKRIEQRWNRMQQEVSLYIEKRNEYQKFQQMIEQKLKQINLDFLNQIQKIHVQRIEDNTKLANFQMDTKKICLHFKQIDNEDYKYIGTVLNQDMKSGKGAFFQKNGSRYYGDFLDDRKDGFGTSYWATGDRYQGEWKNGKREGHGIYHWADGRKWEGQWKNDKRNGKGVHYLFNGDKYEQQFQNGVQKSNKKYD